MENSEVDSIQQNRRLEGHSDVKSQSCSDETAPKAVEKGEKSSKAVEEEDGLLFVLICWVRLVICFLIILVTTVFWTFIMLLLLPWPYERARQGNHFGHLTGKLVVWSLGNTVEIEGKEYSDKRAIFVSNHASMIDMFLAMWLTPTGTVSIAKKEIVWYPLIGQLFFLANHLRIDRSNPEVAIKSLKEAARAVVKNNLSLALFPEGTRSKNGKLLPFKKGFAHLAIQTRLPIVPIVLTGTHNACKKGSLRVRPVHITVKYLPPIKTENWTEDKINEYVNMVYDIFVENLPESQKPLNASANDLNKGVVS